MQTLSLSQNLYDFPDRLEKHMDEAISGLETFVSDTNSIINAFIETNAVNVTDLGPLYKEFDYNEASKQLRLYRFCNKFVVPSDADSERAARSVSDMLEYDAEGLTDFNIGNVPSKFLRYQLQNARFRLQKSLRKLKLDLSEFDMPSGETSVTSGGNVSIYAKLKDKSQWVCSPSSFNLFAQICYNSPGLKYAAKQHMKALGLKHHKFAGPGVSAFDIFKYKLRQVVTFEDVSRLTTVPKNKQVDRVILCEPMCNMICQRCIAKAIVKFVNNEYDIDLYDAQRVHGSLISMDNISTIDLKNASNSNWLAFIKWFLQDTALIKYLLDTRISVVQHKDTFHHLNMIAPMGNGYTFEVMTLILLTLTREFDSFAHVFGDDIIVDDTVAGDVISLLESIGYKINTIKTFTESRFRESCGSFFCDDYITSFDIKYSTNVAEALSTINKVFVLQKLDDLYVPLYRDLVKVTPLALLSDHQYYIPYEVNPMVAYVPRSYSEVTTCNFFKLDDKVCVHPRFFRKTRNKLSREKKTLLNDMSTNIFTKSDHIRFSKKDPEWFPTKNVKGVLIYHYLYAGLGLPNKRGDVTYIRTCNK